jgi:benzil reductase ((S)-benzoin forming)
VRAVVITGVSRGLGAALFDLLARRGDRILAVGRSFTPAQERLARDEPDRVRLHHADLAQARDLPTGDQLRWATGGAATGGAAQAVLVHNAAVIEPIGAVGSLPAAQVAAAVAVNLTAPMLLTNAFLAAAGGPGVLILFISSGAAHHLIEGWAVYSATKRGAEAYFETLAAERPDVRVASVNPGVMDTGMQAGIRAASFPERDRFVHRYQQGELADPEVVARRIMAEHLS